MTIEWILSGVLIPSLGLYLAYLKFNASQNQNVRQPSPTLHTVIPTVQERHSCIGCYNLRQSFAIALQISCFHTRNSQLRDIAREAIHRGELVFANEVANQIHCFHTRTTILTELSRAYRY